jgi:hypothetical protein
MAQASAGRACGSSPPKYPTPSTSITKLTLFTRCSGRECALATSDTSWTPRSNLRASDAGPGRDRGLALGLSARHRSEPTRQPRSGAHASSRSTLGPPGESRGAIFFRRSQDIAGSATTRLISSVVRAARFLPPSPWRPASPPHLYPLARRRLGRMIREVALRLVTPSARFAPRRHAPARGLSTLRHLFAELGLRLETKR